jgi:sporulation protein YlmC with PRC-barrel domain
MDQSNKKLFRLNELSDYKVASDDPDVKGWDVKDTDGKTIGKVDNLLVNKEIQKVVYLEVEADSSIIDARHDTLDKSSGEGIHRFENKEGENHLIIPIGMARINEDENYVFTNELDHKTFAKTNRFKKGSTIDADYEHYILGHYTGDKTKAPVKGDKFYDRDEFNHTKFRGK